MNAKHKDLQESVLKFAWIPGTDPTLDAVEALSKKLGVSRAAAARIAMVKGLNDMAAKERL